MVCGWSACTDCARAIICAGIKTLVRHNQASDRSPDSWKQNIVIADQMLKEAGIEIIDYDGIVDGPSLRHSGNIWNP
jgi:deoxycytidylate deaminase